MKIDMSYCLRKGLSYCRIDGRTIFMDLAADRYFELSPHLDASFGHLLQKSGRTPVVPKELIDLKILREASRGISEKIQPATTECSLSTLELSSASSKIVISDFIETFALVATSRQLLKNRRLIDILRDLQSDRDQIGEDKSGPPTPTTHALIKDISASFNKHRLYVPIEMSCLLDAISLFRFLTRRRIHSNIIFGVTRYPFAAHCWVQVGTTVLNDTVGNVNSHTPIRII